jgi:hypothetical protein
MMMMIISRQMLIKILAGPWPSGNRWDAVLFFTLDDLSELDGRDEQGPYTAYSCQAFSPFMSMAPLSWPAPTIPSLNPVFRGLFLPRMASLVRSE